MKPNLFAMLALLGLTACGGGGESTAPAPERHAAPLHGQSERRLSNTTDGSNVLSDAGFENGDTSWTATDAVLVIGSSSARTGTGYAWLAGYNSANDILYQSVSIPASATSSYLQFWYVIKTRELSAFTAPDTMKVEVYDASGASKLATLATLSNLDVSYAWKQSAQYDLSAYKGKTVRLKFTATTDGSNSTDFLLDDIVVHAPAASSGPVVSGNVATFGGNRSNYTIARTTSGFSVTEKSLGVPANLSYPDVDTLKFADVTINLKVGTKAASISASDLNSLVELYIAYFNRVPDADGMSYWIDQLKAGASLSQIGQSFYSAAVQYSSLTGYTANMSNADFVRLIYKNVLGRATPDTDGLNYWSDALANGTQTRGTLVKTMLESAHSFKGNTTFGWVADLLDNKVSVATYFAVQQGITYNSPSDSISKGMQIASAVTQSDTTAAKGLVPTADPTLNLKPESSTVTCTPPQVLVNGVCTTVSETRIRPGFMFEVAYSPAVSVYYLQFGYVGTGSSSHDTLGSASVTAEEAAEDPEDLPAALDAATKAIAEFNAIIDRLWDAKTYPPHNTMVSIFRGAVQKALAEEDASVAGPYAVSKFVEAGYPAASGGSGNPDTGSGPKSPCKEQYAGPLDDPQVYTFCQNAYGNSCIDRENGTSLYRQQTTVVCGILGNWLKTLGDNRSAQQYCSYCNPANIP